MNEFSYPLRKSLGFMTATANRLLSAGLRRAMKEEGIDLTAEQWGILARLWGAGGSTQEELAYIACVDKSSMSRVLSLMEDKGLITRRVDPANARRKIICATDGAGHLQECCLGVVDHVMELALEGVSDAEYAVCLKVLGAVKDNLRKDGA